MTAASTHIPDAATLASIILRRMGAGGIGYVEAEAEVIDCFGCLPRDIVAGAFRIVETHRWREQNPTIAAEKDADRS